MWAEALEGYSTLGGSLSLGWKVREPQDQGLGGRWTRVDTCPATTTPPNPDSWVGLQRS